MFVEDLNNLDESIRDQFEPYELDGKKGFQHKETIALANSLKNAKEEKEQYKNKLTELEDELNTIKSEESAKIETAKQEVIAKAESSGANSEAIKLLQQELDDMRSRSGETENQYKQRIEKMTNDIKAEKRSAIVSDIVAEIGKAQGAKYLKKIISERIEVDAESGKVTFLNEDGGASSLDLAGFKAELKKDEDIHGFLKAEIVTSGGGNVKGSNNQGGASNLSNNERAEAARKKGDLNAYLKETLKFNT